MNRFVLVASVLERDVLRYTPAGIPIVSASLAHRSDQVEAGIVRQVEFEIPAIAAGEISGRFAELEFGVLHEFSGFMARKSRKSKNLVFHIIDIQPLSIADSIAS